MAEVAGEPRHLPCEAVALPDPAQRRQSAESWPKAAAKASEPALREQGSWGRMLFQSCLPRKAFRPNRLDCTRPLGSDTPGSSNSRRPQTKLSRSPLLPQPLPAYGRDVLRREGCDAMHELWSGHGGRSGILSKLWETCGVF